MRELIERIQKGFVRIREWPHETRTVKLELGQFCLDHLEELADSCPQWEHDRDCCVFLGRLETADLYWCWQGGWPTFIDRYGPEGSEYRSMPWQALRQYEDRKDHVAVRGCWEAYERAKARRLPLDNTPEALGLAPAVATGTDT